VKKTCGKEETLRFLALWNCTGVGSHGPIVRFYYRLYPTVVIEGGSHFWRQDGALQR
jgi:hypothetical protein